MFRKTVVSLVAFAALLGGAAMSTGTASAATPTDCQAVAHDAARDAKLRAVAAYQELVREGNQAAALALLTAIPTIVNNAQNQAYNECIAQSMEQHTG